MLRRQGETDEALRIRREEELPVYERLGYVRDLLVARANLAITLAQRGRLEDAPEIVALLIEAWKDARRQRQRAMRLRQTSNQFSITVSAT